MISEPADPIDVRNNPESRTAASTRPSVVARANDGGAPPREAPEAGDLPETERGGTAEGNPVTGVTISEADAAEAVPGDDGPDGSTPRSSAGHA
jgi:hypothetical protein